MIYTIKNTIYIYNKLAQQLVIKIKNTMYNHITIIYNLCTTPKRAKYLFEAQSENISSATYQQLSRDGN